MEDLVEELVNTRINGNIIKGNKTYENMLKRITRGDIQAYADNFGIIVYANTKLDCIEQIRNNLSGK